MTEKSASDLGYIQELKRSLSLLDLTVYGLIFITPIAPFSTFGIVFNASRGMVALVYVVGLIAMALTAISYATMVETFPVAGSVYSYATLGIGKTPGFLTGWAMLLDYLLIPGFILVICAVAINSVWPGPPRAAWVVLFVAFNTGINLAGIKQTARTGLGLLLLQLLLLVAFIGLCVVALSKNVADAHLSLAPLYSASRFTPSIVFSALSLAVISFLGFDGISTLSEEAEGGAKSVGSAILLALLVAAGLFILQTYAASLFVLDRTSFPAGAPTDEAFYDISALVGGPVFKAIVSIIGVTLAGISGALAAQGAAARLLYGMARDERVPIFLAHISRERRVPSYALLAVAMLTLSVGVALVNHLELLASTVSFGAVVGFMMLHVSVIVHYTLRKRSRKWLRHLVVPLTGIAVLLYVLVNAQPQAKIAGTVWLLIGTLMLAIQTKKSAPVLSQ